MKKQSKSILTAHPKVSIMGNPHGIIPKFGVREMLLQVWNQKSGRGADLALGDACMCSNQCSGADSHDRRSRRIVLPNEV